MLPFISLPSPSVPSSLHPLSITFLTFLPLHFSPFHPPQSSWTLPILFHSIFLPVSPIAPLHPPFLSPPPSPPHYFHLPLPYFISPLHLPFLPLPSLPLPSSSLSLSIFPLPSTSPLLTISAEGDGTV